MAVTGQTALPGTPLIAPLLVLPNASGVALTTELSSVAGSENTVGPELQTLPSVIDDSAMATDDTLLSHSTVPSPDDIPLTQPTAETSALSSDNDITQLTVPSVPATKQLVAPTLDNSTLPDTASTHQYTLSHAQATTSYSTSTVFPASPRESTVRSRHRGSRTSIPVSNLSTRERSPLKAAGIRLKTLPAIPHHASRYEALLNLPDTDTSEEQSASDSSDDDTDHGEENVSDKGEVNSEDRIVDPITGDLIAHYPRHTGPIIPNNPAVSSATQNTDV